MVAILPKCRSQDKNSDTNSANFTAYSVQRYLEYLGLKYQKLDSRTKILIAIFLYSQSCILIIDLHLFPNLDPAPVKSRAR